MSDKDAQGAPVDDEPPREKRPPTYADKLRDQMEPRAEKAPVSSRPDRRRRPGRPKRLAASDALGLSFSIWFRNLPRFFLIAVLIHIPVLVAAYFVLDSLQGLGLRRARGRLESLNRWDSILSFVLFGKLVTGTVTFAVVESLRGRRASIGACFGVAVRRLVPLVLATLASGILLVLPIAIMFLILYESGSSIGFLLLIPVLIIYLILYVVEPVVIAERPGSLGLGALSRSAELTRGDRWPIFGLLVLLFLCYFGVALLVGLVIEGTGALKGSGIYLRYYLPQVAAFLVMPLLSVVSAVVYYQLRLAKEGVDAEEIARVFE